MTNSKAPIVLIPTQKEFSTSGAEIVILLLPKKLVEQEISGGLRQGVINILGSGNKNILLNFGDVTYLGSNGIAALMGSVVDSRRNNGCMKFCDASKRIESLLVMTKLTTIFDYYDTQAKAIASFK